MHLSVLLVGVLLLSACRSATPMPSHVVGADMVPDTILPFVLVEPRTYAYPEQRLSGFVQVRGSSVDVVVTGGFLAIRTPYWSLRNLRAVFANGDPTTGKWNTPFKSDSIPLARLRLAPDGTVTDSMRFRIRRIDPQRLRDHWLTLEMHADSEHPTLGQVERLEWFVEKRVPLLSRAP